jgi:hypothetical protein
MKRLVVTSAALVLLAFTASAWTAEPLIGTWQLDHQELNGEKRETEQVILRVSPEGDKYVFAFSIPINNISFVSMTYTAKLDGTEADVKNARGFKVGTVQITTASPAHYKMVLKGDKHPDSVALLTVSPDGNTLTSDSESKQEGKSAHLVQWFTRH